MIIKNCNMKKIMESGQCFRINKIDTNKYLVISKDLACIAKQIGNDTEIKCNKKDEDYWLYYFDMMQDHDTIGSTFIKDDKYINDAVNFGKGLRLLKQDNYECLVSFIISQRKNIPAIKTSIESLSSTFGEKREIFGVEYSTFPSIEQLYGKSLKDKFGLGYRAEYLEKLVEKLYRKEIDLEKIKQMNYNKGLMELKKIKGVGDKVANCVLLYSLNKENAFPIDIWMQRIIDNEFNGEFPFEKYKHYKGLLQLYMFYYERYK